VTIFELIFKGDYLSLIVHDCVDSLGNLINSGIILYYLYIIKFYSIYNHTKVRKGNNENTDIIIKYNVIYL